MLRSESVKELMPALIKAQSKFKHAKKDSVNPHFKSRYSTFSSVLDACIEPLNSNGIMLSQTTKITEHALILITTLTHSSGEFISSEMPILNMANTPQGMGSALSYAKRYALQSILGIATGDEDDDGEHAMARPKEPFETAHFVADPQANQAPKNHTHKYSAATHKCFIGIRDESGKYRECGALDPES